MQRTYHYVGPEELRQTTSERPRHVCVQQAQDVLFWIKGTGQMLEADSSVTATFIVATDNSLWIADRHSEHIQCADGAKVLSAGEITFSVEKTSVSVVGITNQSTGYCPEPESWPSVAVALYDAGIQHPSHFTTAFLFRRCEECGMTNIIKEDVFECGVCQSQLPLVWNY